MLGRCSLGSSGLRSLLITMMLPVVTTRFGAGADLGFLGGCGVASGTISILRYGDVKHAAEDHPSCLRRRHIDGSGLDQRYSGSCICGDHEMEHDILGSGGYLSCRLRGGGPSSAHSRMRAPSPSRQLGGIQQQQQPQGQKASGIKPPTRTRMGAELTSPSKVQPAQSVGTKSESNGKETLVGRDVEPSLGLRVVMSQSSRKTRPFVQDRGEGSVTAVHQSGEACMVQFDKMPGEYLYNTGSRSPFLHALYVFSFCGAINKGVQAVTLLARHCASACM